MPGLFSDPRVDAVIGALREVEGWPSDDAADDKFARRLIGMYPEVDLVEAIGDWSVWLMDHPEVASGTKNWRLRLHTWLKEGRRHGVRRRERARQYRPGVRAAGVAQRGGGARPGRDEEFPRAGRLDDF